MQKLDPLSPTPWQLRLAAAAALAVTAWLGTEIGLFAPIDGILYDTFARVRGSRIGAEREPAVYQVRIDDRSILESEERLLELLDTLADLECRLVVFAFQPPARAERLYRKAIELGNVVFGIPIRPSAKPGGGESLEDPVPGWSRLPWGVLVEPSLHDGVCRTQPRLYRESRPEKQRAPREAPAIEVVAASRVLGAPQDAGGEPYLVDFPRRELSRLVVWPREQPSPEEIQGRCVLVGPAPRPGEIPVPTPLAGEEGSVSLLEYRACAIETLLSENGPRTADARWRLGILVALAVLSTMIYQQLGARIAVAFTLLTLGGYAAVGGWLLVHGSLWFPLTGLGLTQVLLHAAALQGTAVRLTEGMRRLISDASSYHQDKYWPLDDRNREPPWAMMAGMIHQTLDINRLLFLAAQAEGSRVREILALHCSMDDILERRRDYTRAPYVHAIKLKGPIKVESFLRRGGKDEEQYLVPLIFCDEVLGFWALGIDKAKAAMVPGFEALLRDYARKISELLHQEKGDEDRMTGHLERLQGQFSGALYREASAKLGLLEERLETLDGLLNSLNTGLIIYDVFGRVLQINEAMLGLLKDEGLAPFELSALDLILALSENDLGKSRKLLRRVTVEQSPVTFPVKLRSHPAARFVIFLKPLVGDTTDVPGVAAQEGSTRHVICELVDTTSLSRLYELKCDLTTRLGQQLRRDLGVVDLSARLLRTGRITAEQRADMTGVISERVQQGVLTLSECQQYVALDSDLDELERFPVDPQEALEQAVAEAGKAAYLRGVRIEVHQPRFVSYVLASATKLAQVFQRILELLTQDAAEHSAIQVTVKESRDTLRLEFVNNGFGIPDELFQGYLGGEQPAGSEEFQNIQVAEKWLQGWGGSLSGRSGVGTGMRFDVELIRFL